MRLTTTVRHPTDSDSSDAAVRHGANGSEGSDSSSESRPDSDPGTPRRALRARIRDNFHSTTSQAFALSNLSSGGPRHAGNCSALLHTSRFYQDHIVPTRNDFLLERDERFLRLNECSWPGTVRRQINAGITRKASFLTIKPVLKDIGILTDARTGRPLPALDSATVEVLETTLEAASIACQAVALAALSDARDGQRAMPLTLDYEDFASFITDHENTLLQVRNACAPATPSTTQLKPLLESLAGDYLRASGRMPTGLAAGSTYSVDGVLIADEPITVLVGQTASCDGYHLLEQVSSKDKVLLRIGRNVLNNSGMTNALMVENFESRDPACRRAALVLGAFFQEMTFVEEQIAANGTHCRTPRDRAQSARTLEELSYTGSDPVGDAVTPIGASDRDDALKPLRNMPGVMRRYELTHGKPLLPDPDMREWIEGPRFAFMLDLMITPARRLSNIQVRTTCDALLECRALGGPGLT